MRGVRPVRNRAVNAIQNILFVDQTGELGGAEFCLADLAVHLRNSCAVFLFESGPFQQLLEKNGVRTVVAGVPATNVGKNSKFFAYLLAIPAFVRLVVSLIKAAKRSQVLYANTAKALVVTAVAAFVLQKPFLFHLHDIIDARHFNRLNRWLLATAASLAAGVVANSQATAAAFRAVGGNNGNLAVVPNGFQLGRFLTDDISPNRAVRAAIGCNDKPLVGLFGRITEWKGQKVLIQALGQIADVHAVIVGDALFTDKDRRYKRSLGDLSARLGVAHRVHFAGFQPDIVPFLRAVDLVVHCSISPEPFGRVIVEAQLTGKPVISSKCGAPAEIIVNGVSGILVNPGDPAELAGAIKGLLGDPARAGEMATKGKELAANRYALDNVLRDWVHFIGRSVGGAISNSCTPTSIEDDHEGRQPTCNSPARLQRLQGERQLSGGRRDNEWTTLKVSKFENVRSGRTEDAISDRT